MHVTYPYILMFQFVKKLFGKGRGTNNLTDEGRELSHVSHKLNAMRKRELDSLKLQMEHLNYLRQQKMIQEQIEDMKDELYGSVKDEGFDEDQLLMSLFAPFIQKFQQGQQPSQLANTNVSMSDEDIQSIIEQFPPDKLKLFAKLPAETQKKLILSRFPNADEESVNRALEMIQER